MLAQFHSSGVPRMAKHLVEIEPTSVGHSVCMQVCINTQVSLHTHAILQHMQVRTHIQVCIHIHKHAYALLCEVVTSYHFALPHKVAGLNSTAADSLFGLPLNVGFLSTPQRSFILVFGATPQCSLMAYPTK